MKFETANQNTTWDIRITLNKDKVKPAVAGLKLYGGVNINDQRLVNYVILCGIDEIFYVVTTNFKFTNPKQFWERELKKVRCSDFNVLSDIAKVAHVRHFTRMSQRRFMWGDVDATREDVQRAVKTVRMTTATSC